jgi:hypothetical protein
VTLNCNNGTNWKIIIKKKTTGQIRKKKRKKSHLWGDLGVETGGKTLTNVCHRVRGRIKHTTQHHHSTSTLRVLPRCGVQSGDSVNDVHAQQVILLCVVLEYRDGSLRIGLHTIGVEWRGLVSPPLLKTE